MMRVCHLDTCPVGVATQNPVLRERYAGKPEFVVNFFEFIAEEVRELLAELGFRTLEEAVGHAELLDVTQRGAPLEGRRSRPAPDPARARAARGRARGTTPPTQDHGLDKALDNELVALAGRRAGARRAGPRPGADPQRQPHRRHDPRPRGDQALQRRGAARRHDRHHLHRLGRPVVRRVRAARHDAAARGRRQRLRRQGPVRRPDRGPPRPRRDLRRGRADHRRQRHRVRRDVAARSSCAARSASASASATPGRPRSSRASATTAAST